MKISVINGSPKGDLSVTLQYINFIQKKYPRHEFHVHHVGQRIRKIEKDENAFREIIEDVKASDGVIWSVPLYVLLIPSQCKRFIELIGERGVESAFRGKYAAVLTTSIHFFDHTAHNYMNAVCDDLGMKYAGGYSPDMFDLMKDECREGLLLFAESFFEHAEKGYPTARNFPPLRPVEARYTPGPVKEKTVLKGKRALILTDSLSEGSNLAAMIRRFRESFDGEVESVSLESIDIRGGCLGCIRCGFDNVCAYDGKDGYRPFYEKSLLPADLLILAGSLKDRYLSSDWKEFFDRSFFNTHTPTLIGKQIGFLISGPLGQIPNLREIFQAYAEFQQANLAGIVTDESPDSGETDALLENLARRMVDYAVRGYIKPATFLGVGGMKIFRDDIWGRLRFAFQGDHKYYTDHGLYDFPQEDAKSQEINKMMFELTKDPVMREQVRKMIKTEMVKPHQKVVETK